MIETQFEALKALRAYEEGPAPVLLPLSNGSHLVAVPGVVLPPGWNRTTADILFVAPIGYPTAPPDCFWIEPANFRLSNNGTPQNTNDSNPIPGDANPSRSTTWFSWHVQAWNPTLDSLVTYLNVIRKRLRHVQ
jgi:Prokaryotic E2 family E